MQVIRGQRSEVSGQRSEIRDQETYNLYPAEMAERKLALITRAILRHPGEAISFCGEAVCWDECFTLDGDNRLMFWYNVGKDTRAIEEGTNPPHDRRVNIEHRTSNIE